MRRNFVRNKGKEYLDNRFMTQTKNSFSLLSKEDECSKCNNFGDTVENCRLRQIKEEEKPEDICGIALYAQKEERNGTLIVDVPSTCQATQINLLP